MARMLMLLCGISSAAMAVNDAEPALTKAAKFADPTVVAAPISGVSGMAQVTVALFIVLAVLFVGAWAVRQFKLVNRSGLGVLQVVQGIHLGPKERAVLVRINNRQVLLGVAPGCVNLLLELTDDPGVTPDSMTPPADASATADTPNFKALLKRSMGLS